LLAGHIASNEEAETQELESCGNSGSLGTCKDPLCLPIVALLTAALTFMT
jgi:hypothetical protein